MNIKVLTGAVLIPVGLAMIILPNSEQFFWIMFIITFFAFSEFVTMFRQKKYFVFAPSVVMLLFTMDYLRKSPQMAIYLMAASVLVISSVALLGKDPVEEKYKRIVIYLAGYTYLLMTLSFFPLLRDYPVNGKMWFLFAMIIPWLCDSGAYFAGIKLGRHKFAPAISPKKTWEGALGGLVVSILGGVAFCYIVFKGDYLLFSIAAAAICSSAGQIGDLVESLFKRGAGVKDSGNLFPGHGGILDRLDSLLFSVVSVYFCLKFMEYYAGK